ncbi:MAG: hypothetical protein AB7V16_06935 [Vulcanibacillus sp.]
MSNQLSEVKQYIKSLFSDISNLEEHKGIKQEELFNRIIYLLELYINQEVDLYLQNRMADIVNKVLEEIKKQFSEENNGTDNVQ